MTSSLKAVMACELAVRAQQARLGTDRVAKRSDGYEVEESCIVSGR